MDSVSQFVPLALVVGLGATLIMDLWNMFLKRVFGIPSLDYCLLGRWIGHMPGGVFRHARITAAAPKPYECTLGWVSHYSIGGSFGIIFLLLVPGYWVAHPTPLFPMLFGIGTVVFPLFVMQPSLGLGIASSRTPSPWKSRLKSLLTHTVFGLGMYLIALSLTVLRL